MNQQTYSLVSYHRSPIHLVPKPQAHSHLSFFRFLGICSSLQKDPLDASASVPMLLLYTDAHSQSFHAHYALNIHLAANCLQERIQVRMHGASLSQHFPLPILLSHNTEECSEACVKGSHVHVWIFLDRSFTKKDYPTK